MANESSPLVLHQTFDFETLMREARKHITQIAGALWTDHNSSDPGITQLEILAFCIADLSYRTSFPIEDILTGYKGGKQLPIDLPLPDVALTGAPVTIKDLRKVLIDMPYVSNSRQGNSVRKLLLRNAFPQILETPEYPFYLSQSEKKRAFLTHDKHAVPGFETGDKLPPAMVLNGLYRIQLEFEEEIPADNERIPYYLQDLNRNYFRDSVVSNGVVYELNVLLPYWDEIDWELRFADPSNYAVNYLSRPSGDDYFIAVDKLNYDDYFYDYYAEIALNNLPLTAYIRQENPLQGQLTVGSDGFPFTARFIDWNELSNGVKRDYTLAALTPLTVNDIRCVSMDADENLYDIEVQFAFPKTTSSGQTTVRHVKLLVRIAFDPLTGPDTNRQLEVRQALLGVFPDLLQHQIQLEDAIYRRIGSSGSGIYNDYIAKINRVFQYLYGANGVWSYLGQYRNLCEDFSGFTASRVQEIALFGTLHLAPAYNCNEILAQIYYRIDRFLNPMVRFRSLSEMTEAGYSYDTIFNGPLLKHGFITDEDLAHLKRRSVVYTSDLIRIIMDVPGVEAVSDFTISGYIDNRLMGRKVVNCLQLTDSEVYQPRFSEGKTSLSAQVAGRTQQIDKEVIHAIYQELITAEKKQQLPDGNWKSLSIPVGYDMEIEAYRTVQHDFPEVYGIGEFGLPLDASEARKGLARQLKGYLMPFEQLLANYLKQVAHLPELFSFNRAVDRTYAVQPLYDIPDIQPLFAHFNSNNDTWDTFVQDLNNGYRQLLDTGESPDTFRGRRNRFLSHLLARFGESFANYAVHEFDRHKALLNNPQTIGLYQQKRAGILDKLISDKIAFAEDYPLVTGKRSNGFNTTLALPGYQAPGMWASNNTAAYKLRICRLLGIQNTDDTFLFGTMVLPDGTSADREGMHVVEHILLRPHWNTDHLLEPGNGVSSQGQVSLFDADKDPYSFTITLVLPAKAERFADPDFRAFAEQTIRMETPAHVRIRFCWMSTECGKRFEKAFSEWKKYVSLLQPHLFQKRDKISEYVKSALTIYPPKKGKGKDTLNISDTVTSAERSFITLRQELIDTLNTPCNHDLTVYDASEIPFTCNDHHLVFTWKTTDIFHIRVGETGGKLICYKWENGSWKLKSIWSPVTESYFPVSKLIQKTSIGLTTIYGGVGDYLLYYNYPDGSTSTLTITVLKPVVPVKFTLVENKMILPFDTEKDGVFKRSNRNWENACLEWNPKGGKLTLQSRKGGAPFVYQSEKDTDCVWLKDLYKEYDFGVVDFTYEKDGQVTTASIELYAESDVRILGDDRELIPVSEHYYELNEAVVRVDLLPEIKGGTLRVYGEMPTAPAGKERGVSMTNGTGSVFELGNVQSFTFYPSESETWVSGTVYTFCYTIDNTENMVRFRMPSAKQPQPVIAIFEDDKILETPIRMAQSAISPKWMLQLVPAGGVLEYWLKEGDLEQRYCEMQMPEEGTMFSMATELPGWPEEWAGPVSIRYRISEQSFAELECALIGKMLQSVTAPVIRESTTGRVIAGENARYELVFDLSNPDQMYHFYFEDVTGKLELTGSNGKDKQFFTTNAKGLYFSAKVLKQEVYQAVYVSDLGQKIAFTLDVEYFDPEFTFTGDPSSKVPYALIATPVHQAANSYVWKMNGKVVARTRQLKCVANFSKSKEVVLSLTIHCRDMETTKTVTLTPEMFVMS